MVKVVDWGNKVYLLNDIIYKFDMLLFYMFFFFKYVGRKGSYNFYIVIDYID